MTRKALAVLTALSATLGCGHAPKPPPSSVAVNKCPLNPDSFTSKFRDDRPPLSKGVACLSLPARTADQVSAWFRDPRHPFLPGKHGGIDLPAPVGTLVFAPAAGIVTFAGASEMDTNLVQVSIGGGWSYHLGHLRVISVEKGQRVLRGQVLGLSGGEPGDPGSGPCTTGPHLHYSLKYKGALVDPLKYSCDNRR